jgi:outer membrane protein
LEDFMKRYAEKNSYKMILSYKQGVTLWYADPKLDVTADAIKSLNDEYNKQSTAPAAVPATDKK